MKKIIYIMLIFLEFSNVYANQKSDEIIKIVMSADGYINEKLYNEYWEQFKSKPSLSELENIRHVLTAAAQWQYHIWSAVKLSAKHKKIIRTPELEKTLKHMTKYNAQKATENTNMLLNAAANGIPADIRGQKQYITEDLCDEVLSGLGASIERVSMLLCEAWKPVAKERKITPWMSVLTVIPFVQTEVVINNITQSQYSFKLDEENQQVITAVENKIKNTNISTDDCIKGIAESIDVEAKLITKNSFRGKQASSSSFVIKDKNYKIFLNAICINYDKYLISIITTSASIFEVNNNHDLLLNNVQLK